MSEVFRSELVRRRTMLKMTAKELSTKAGYGPTMVRDIEEGRTKNPTLETAIDLAKALGCNLADMIGDKRVRPLSIEQAMIPRQDGVPEIDVYGGAGAGGEGALEAFSYNGESFTGDAVKGFWGLPQDYLDELRIPLSRARLIRIKGDSMEPTISGDDRVIVDIGDRVPTPDGIFAIWDGLGVVVKRLEHVPFSDPHAFKILSDNPHHTPYERLLEEINIIGRVIWLARRL